MIATARPVAVSMLYSFLRASTCSIPALLRSLDNFMATRIIRTAKLAWLPESAASFCNHISFVLSIATDRNTPPYHREQRRHSGTRTATTTTTTAAAMATTHTNNKKVETLQLHHVARVCGRSSPAESSLGLCAAGPRTTASAAQQRVSP